MVFSFGHPTCENPAEERLSFYEKIYMIYQVKIGNVIYIRSSKNIERQRDIPGSSLCLRFVIWQNTRQKNACLSMKVYL